MRTSVLTTLPAVEGQDSLPRKGRICWKYATVPMLPITILVPTMNRPDYLQRALAYYRAAGFDGCILIGDSSEGEAAEQVREIAGRFAGGRVAGFVNETDGIERNVAPGI